MKKIVFIVNGYYPDYSANGICIKKIVDNISNEAEVHIISQNLGKTTCLFEEYENTYIHRVKTFESRLRNWINEKIESANNRIIRTLFTFILNVIRFVYWIQPVFQKYTLKKPLISAYENCLEHIDNIDMVFGVCFPMEGLIAATHYAGNHKDTKCGCILFDKFSTNISHQKNRNNMERKFEKHVQLESNLFSSMDVIVATYDWEKYLKKYHGRIYTNVHFIDIPALKVFDEKEVDSTLNEYAYLGMVDRNIRPIDKVLPILGELDIEDVRFSFAVKGNLYDYVNNFCKETDNFTFYGTVPIERSYEIQCKCRGLLSIGNTDTSQTPSKIFEYVGTGKPIVHFYFDKNDRCIEILNRYENALCFNVNNYNKKDLSLLKEFLYKAEPINTFDIKRLFMEADPKYTAMKIMSYITE